MEILKIYTRRSHYSAEDAAAATTLTVGRLREILEDLDDDIPVVTCASQDFAKYGFLNANCIECVDTEYDED